MRFITSSATSAGEAAILIYFEPGTDPNINVVNVQNRVNIVLFQLPPLVVREGILVSQVVPSMLMYVNIYSTDPNADQKDLFNFANVYVMPRLKRIKGMGIPRNLGNRIFAMRVWLDPDRMRAYNVSSEDVMKALSEQSVIGSPGRLGQATGKTSQSKEYVLTYVGRFNKPEQYEGIILKANPDGEILRLKDVGQVELGPQFFEMVLAIGVVVDDAIVVVEAVHAKMAQRHLSPYRATMEVVHEISGAIIAITLVMTSVFVPVTFIPGAVGTFYRAFGITMATSIILSGLVALTLTPVLCAMILKPHGHDGADSHAGDA